MPDIIESVGFPFTSVGGDRATGANSWRQYFDKMMTGHVVPSAGNEMQVKPQGTPNKSVYVDTGAVFIIGAMLIKASTETLSIADNASGNARIDRIVARINYADRMVELVVKQGTPSSSPVAPTLVQDTSTYYEVSLARIAVANGFTTITSGEITDERDDVSVCGYARFRVSNATASINGLMSATDKAKIDGIEDGATADQTGSEIKSLYEAQSNTNAYTDGEKSKLSGIESGATADQTGSEIKSLYEAQTNTNAYTDEDKAAISNLGKYTEVTVSTDYSPGSQGSDVVFDTEDNDDLGMWSSGDPTKIIIPSGVSLVSVYGIAPGAGHGDDDTGESIKLNGNYIAGRMNSQTAGVHTSAIPVSQGDYFQLYHYGTSSGTTVKANSKLRVVVLR